MSDLNVCPRTGEVCEWREACASSAEEFRREERRAEWSSRYPVVGQLSRALKQVVPGFKTFEMIAAEAGAEARQREAILDMSCAREEICIVFDAMESQGITISQETNG